MNPFDGLTMSEDKLRALADCDWSTLDPTLIVTILNEAADELDQFRMQASSETK